MPPTETSLAPVGQRPGGDPGPFVSSGAAPERLNTRNPSATIRADASRPGSSPELGYNAEPDGLSLELRADRTAEVEDAGSEFATFSTLLTIPRRLRTHMAKQIQDPGAIGWGKESNLKRFGRELRASRAAKVADAPRTAKERTRQCVTEPPAGRTKRLAALGAALLALSVATALPSAQAAECAGDECQAPTPPPDDPIPPTAVVNGPPNPPVHYPKVHSKGAKPKANSKHRHRGHRHRGRR